jgi:Zn-dependent protease with chaperone function
MTLWLIAASLCAAGRDPVFEADLRQKLEAVAPAAVKTFDDATRAMDEGRTDEAIAGFQAVTEAAPDFDAGHRRLCSSLMMARRLDDAVKHCERARTLDQSFPNEVTLTRLKVLRDADADLQDTRAWIDGKLRELPRGSENWAEVKGLDCVNKQRRGGGQTAACGEEFVNAVPDSPTANYFAIESAVRNDDWPLARARLERARPVISDDEYERMRRALEENEPATSKWGRPGLKVLEVWGGSLLGLIVLGLLLSQLTLRSARKLSTAREEHAAGGARALRAVYRAIVAFGSIFYYLSLPIVVAAVLLLMGGLIYAFFVMGRVPIKIVAILFVTGITTVFAVLRSLFVRASDEDPGETLDWEKAPKLRALLDRIAATVGTRPVDRVYLTPGTDLAVFERGGLRKRWAGQSERCLILGVGVLDGFKVGPFMSVLAHEHGHFSNQDTAGGDLALWARRSLFGMGRALAMSGAATWYNPAWWFFRGYFAVFLRISQGASRLQEVLADRRAIFSYGSAAFRDGYTHVLRRSIGFDAHANTTLKEVIEGKKALGNLYRFTPAVPPTSATLDDAFRELLEREPSPYDSHPSSKQRLEWAATLDIPGKDEPGTADDVWSLFEARDELERLMTTVIRSNIAATHQIVIREAAPPQEAADTSAKSPAAEP